MYTEFNQEGFFVATHYEAPAVIQPGNFVTEAKWPQPIHIPKYNFDSKTIIEGMQPELIAENQQMALVREAKKQAATQIEALTVTVGTLVFDANEKSQLRMLAAISAARKLGQVETPWKLADDSEAVVTLTQLEEAQAKAIQALGTAILST